MSTLNPLRCSGTPLPPSLLLACKLLVICLFARGYVLGLPEPFLPMWPIFDWLPYSWIYRPIAITLFSAAALGLLLNRAVCACALVAGIVFLLEPISSRVTFYYGNFFCACFLILAGLYQPRFGPLLLRAQFSVMYFGSAVNKLLDPDWHSGHFLDYWMGDVLHSERYEYLAGLVPPGQLALVLSWMGIAIELVLAVGFLIPRHLRFCIWIAVIFHANSVLLSRHDFGVFVCALFSAMPALAQWPKAGSIDVYCGPGRVALLFRRVSHAIHFDGLFRWHQSQRRPFESGGFLATLRMETGTRTYSGLAAVNYWLLLNPLPYFIAALFMSLPFVSHQLQFRCLQGVLVIGALWFSPIPAWILRAVRIAKSWRLVPKP